MRVLVFGTFDLLHPGHHFLLTEAQSRGELFVVIARDHNVEKIKGFLPHQSEGERKVAIETAYPSAHVLFGDAHDFQSPIRSVKPDLILLGYDQKLPPGVTAEDFPCPVERLPAFEPHTHKSSLKRQRMVQ